MMRSLLLAASLFTLSSQAAAQCTGCSVQHYGQGCGPSLTATLTAGGGPSARLNVHLDNGAADSFGIMIWGTQQLDLPLPGTLCSIYTDYVWGHFFQIAPDGTADVGHAWPNNNPGYFFIQMVDIERQGTVFGAIRTTNGARVERT